MAGLAIPTPRTWTVADPITAARLNALRDAINFLANPPHYAAHQSTAQSLPNAAFAQITLDTIDADPYSGAGSNNYTIPVSGWYDIAGGVSFAANATGIRIAGPMINGGYGQSSFSPGTSANSVTGLFNTYQFLAAGATVGLDAYQSSGAALNTAPSSVYSFLAVRWRHA